MCVQLALVACYTPLITVAAFDVNKRTEDLGQNVYINKIEFDTAWSTAASLVYLNSSLNPILYFWKIREVRQLVKDTIKQLYKST